MVDNLAVTPGTGATVAADDIAGVLVQRVKTTWGPDGTMNDADVASGKPLPVQLRSPTGTDLTGTAGSASAAVITVQGVASGTSLLVEPAMQSGGNATQQTNATGATYNALSSQVCKQVTIMNNTGTAIGVQQGGSGAEVPVFDQSYFTFYGLTNANQLGIRRVDVSNTPVTAAYRWEA